MRSNIALPIVLAVLLSASTVAAKLRVVSTLPDFSAIAEELGGERVSAESLLKGTQDPHFADAKPSLILKVNRADLLIIIGLGLEAGWLPVLMTQARNANIQVGAQGYLDASQYVTVKEVPVKADRAVGDVHSGGNPHYYTAPDQLFRVAPAILAKLIELDPDGRDFYEGRWKAFAAKFEQKTAERRTDQVADNGDRGKNREHFPPFIAGHIHHHRHDHRTIDGRGKTVEEADHQEAVVRMNQKIEKGDDGKKYQADQHGFPSADDIGDHSGRHFKKYSGDRRNGHGESNGLRTDSE